MSFCIRHAFITPRLLAPLLLGAGLALSSQAMADNWPDKGWEVIPTEQGYTALLESLQSAISEADMFVVTEAGPTEAAAQRGIEIPGNRVVGVFRNDFAVRILRQSVPAMIEAPLRFYVTENEDGSATLAWKVPSAVFSPYSEGKDDELARIAAELDALFADIGADTTAP